VLVALSAEEASAAGLVGMDDDEIADFEMPNLLAHRHHFPRQLVTWDERKSGGKFALKKVAVCPANATGTDRHDHFIVRRCWVGHISDPPSFWSVQHDCLHSASPAFEPPRR
jgi:hypothetical protein